MDFRPRPERRSESVAMALDPGTPCPPDPVSRVPARARGLCGLVWFVRATERDRRLLRRDHALAASPARLDLRSKSAHHPGVAELPSGTVTFLFTDVEGSTRLLRELGDAYADVLGEHRRALATCSRCMAEWRWTRRVMRSLSPSLGRQTLWPRRPRGRRPSGRARSKCAWAFTPVSLSSPTRATSASTSTGRLGSLRQVTAVRSLFRKQRATLSAGISMRDLGKHRLKDLAAPERIYQAR